MSISTSVWCRMIAMCISPGLLFSADHWWRAGATCRLGLELIADGERREAVLCLQIVAFVGHFHLWCITTWFCYSFFSSLPSHNEMIIIRCCIFCQANKTGNPTSFASDFIVLFQPFVVQSEALSLAVACSLCGLWWFRRIPNEVGRVLQENNSRAFILILAILQEKFSYKQENMSEI